MTNLLRLGSNAMTAQQNRQGCETGLPLDVPQIGPSRFSGNVSLIDGSNASR